MLRQNYVSSSVQTLVGGKEDWYEPTVPHTTRRTHYISLTKRLLLRCKKDWERLEVERSAVLDISNEKHDSCIQSSSSDDIKEPKTGEPPNAIQVGVSEEIEMEYVTHQPETPVDTEMKDIGHHTGPETGSVPSNIPVQKPRPPDQAQAPSHPTTIMEIKHPPLPSLSQVPKSPSTQYPHTNGFHPNKLRVQTSSALQIPHETASDSSSVNNPNSIHFTQTSNSHPPTSPANSSSPINPTPVKKKISVGEYNILFRRKAESQSTSDKISSVGSVSQQNMFKAPAVLKGPAIIGAAEKMIADTTIEDAKL